MRRCVWSRNLKNEEALDQWGLLHKKNEQVVCVCHQNGWPKFATLVVKIHYDQIFNYAVSKIKFVAELGI